MAGLLSILIVLLTSVAIRQESRLHQDRTTASTQAIASLLARHLDSVFTKTDALLQSTADHYGEEQRRDRFDETRFNAHLKRQVALFAEVSDLYVIDAHGVARYGTGSVLPVSLADREDFRRARDASPGGLVFSGPSASPMTRKWGLVLSRRLTQPDGTFAGLVLANLNIDRLAPVFSEIAKGTTGTIALRTADLAPLYRHPANAKPDDEADHQMLPQLRRWVAQSPPGGTDVAIDARGKAAQTVSYKKTGDYPFYITVSSPSGGFWTAEKTSASFLAGLSGLMLLVTALGTWRIYRLSQRQTAQRIEKKAALVLEASPVAMLLVDARGKITEANKAATLLLGMERSELLGSGVDALIPLRFRGAHAGHRQTFMQHATARVMGNGADLLVLHRSGREIPVQVALAPLEIARRRHAIVVLESQTERKRAAQELHDLLALQTAILDNAAYAITATDRRGVITAFNKAAERIYGYRADEVIGKQSSDIFYDPDELRQRAQEYSATQPGELAESGFGILFEPSRHRRMISDEMTCVRRDGSRFPASQSIAELRNAAGEFTGHMAIVTDISERRAQEEKLNDTLARLKLATDAADIGVWSWNFEDDKLEWDDRLCDWYGVPPARRNGLHYYDFWRSRVHPDDVQAATARMAQARQDNAPFEDVFRIVQPEGGVRFIHSASVIENDRDGKPLRMIGVNRDVTSQRELETQLRTAKEAADAASQAKSSFLANMSHEIRTPMNAILGLTGLLTETALTPRQGDLVSRVHNSTKALLRVLNDILDYSKIEAGQLQIEQAPFELNSVIDGITGLFAALVAEKKVTWDVALDPALPRYLEGDSLRLSQILINLVGNALKFTEEGAIRIQIGIQTENAAGITLQIQVTDTGIGMSQAQMDRLFGAFVQADNSISRRYGGTGLGLSIARRLVHLMGGEIAVVSAPGQGSTFSFTVQLRRAGESPRTPAPPRDSAVAPAKPAAPPHPGSHHHRPCPIEGGYC